MNASSTKLHRKIRRAAGRARSHAARGGGMRSRGVQNAAERGGRRRKIWKPSKAVWKPCNPLKSHKTAKDLFGKAWSKTREFWRSLEKGLQAAFIPPPLAPSRQRPPIERDRHCEEKLRSNPGSRSSRERRPERGKAAGPFHPRGPAGGRCGTRNVRGEESGVWRIGPRSARPRRQNGVARKWRRKGLKRLNPRPEMVWARKPRTHKMWYTGAVTARLRAAE